MRAFWIVIGAISYLLGASALPSDAQSTDLGASVQTATTGRDPRDLVQERFLDAVGLTQTAPSTSRALPGLAVGYTLAETSFGQPPGTMDETGVLLWNPAVPWTGGGFVGTPHDLAVRGNVLFSGDALTTPYPERLLEGVPVDPDALRIQYGSGVSIFTQTEFGPVYDHGGWVPGCVSSQRHSADYGVDFAFQINTDIGIVGDSTDLASMLEHALVTLVNDSIRKD